MDKYSQKIDRLPVLDVDAELLDWGEKTAQTLRVMAGSRRGSSLAAGSQKSGLRTGASTDSYYNVSVSTATSTANDANQIDLREPSKLRRSLPPAYRFRQWFRRTTRRRQTRRTSQRRKRQAHEQARSSHHWRRHRRL
jgi:hypothetical protein